MRNAAGRQLRRHDLAAAREAAADDGADFHVERILRRRAKARQRPAERARVERRQRGVDCGARRALGVGNLRERHLGLDHCRELPVDRHD
ncbi:MAG TPA: hypothetical protein VK362_03470 [Reyranella sp.]|nr:hypothetical protein [Reyranella sp.]